MIMSRFHGWFNNSMNCDERYGHHIGTQETAARQAKQAQPNLAMSEAQSHHMCLSVLFCTQVFFPVGVLLLSLLSAEGGRGVIIAQS